MPDIEQPADSKGNHINQQPVYDKMIITKAMLQSNMALQRVKVIKRCVTLERVIIGL